MTNPIRLDFTGKNVSHFNLYFVRPPIVHLRRASRSIFGPSSSMIERTSASELIDKCAGHRYSTAAVALVSHIPGFYCNSVVTGMLRWKMPRKFSQPASRRVLLQVNLDLIDSRCAQDGGTNTPVGLRGFSVVCSFRSIQLSYSILVKSHVITLFDRFQLPSRFRE